MPTDSLGLDVLRSSPGMVWMGLVLLIINHQCHLSIGRLSKLQKWYMSRKIIQHAKGSWPAGYMSRALHIKNLAIVCNELLTSFPCTMAHVLDSLLQISVLCVALHVESMVCLVCWTCSTMTWHDHVFNPTIFTKTAMKCFSSGSTKKLTTHAGHSK